MKKSAYYYFLQAVPGIGNKTISLLLQNIGKVEQVYDLSEKELGSYLKPKQLFNFLSMREKMDPEKELEKLIQKGIRYLSIEDLDYPKRLKNIPDAPFGIFVMGRLPDKLKMSAAIIGTRNHSLYGEKMTIEYSRILALHGINVISGMAKGIDGIAHKNTLLTGGLTYAVLGCGVDVCYPKENMNLYQKIKQTGGIISEYLPGTQPMAGLFPPRNRIISGLSDMVLVMEAREKSGTLITVDMALEQGKDVYALPGRVSDPLSRGCNRLIRQGAYLLPEPEIFQRELEEYLGLESQKIKRTNHKEMVQLSEVEKTVYECIGYDPMSMEEIFNRIQKINKNIDIIKLTKILMQLCINCLINQENGLFFRK